MSRVRALVVTLAVAVFTGVFAGAASATRDCVPAAPFSHTLCTQHFAVYYSTDLNGSGGPAADYSTETDAGDIASYAEQAYATYRSWGYTAPLTDPDGYVDIQVVDGSGPPAFESEWGWSGAGPGPSSGLIILATPTQLKTFATQNGTTLGQEEQQEIALNVFHMFQLAQWTPTTGADYWLFNAVGTWAAFASPAIQPAPPSIGDPDIALDCSETLGPNHRMCDPNLYDDGGFARWAFFDLLASRYGNSFFKTIFTNGGAGQSAETALTNALVAKGTTLTSTYTDYVNRYMSGTIAPALASARPPAFAAVTTGATATTTTTVADVPVDHLSARYVTFDRGDGDGSHPCFAAQLTINVAIPSGSSAQPYFYWDFTGSTPQALTINGSTASITVPWDTCDWGTTHGWLSLPNASTSTDGASFIVSDSMTVDPTTPAAPTQAPTPVSVWGTTVPVPSTDAAPSIDVFGPELLKVDAKSPVIRLIVQSSGAGTVNAALGSVALGSGALRAGENDIRFAVPKGMLASLRRSASAANTLTLTPVSPTGAVTGTAVTRTVVIAATPKPKPHAKPKPKPKKK